MSDPARTEAGADEEDGSKKLFGGKRGEAAPAASRESGDAGLLEYSMNNVKRGTCIVFNQVEFHQRTGQSKRAGSDVDADNLERSFKNLGFTVKTFRNLTCKNILSVMEETASADHSKSDCLAVAMLSHGEDGCVYGFDGRLRLELLARAVRPDKCPGLAGKPKLFFFQACRGSEYDKGVLVHEVADGDADDKLDAASRLTRIPLESDFLFFYSTPPGYYSWRNDVDGSWFVQQLCRALNQYGDSVELTHLLLIVQRLVAADFQSRTNEEKTSGMKQIPVSVSTLRKLVYFKRK